MSVTDRSVWLRLGFSAARIVKRGILREGFLYFQMDIHSVPVQERTRMWTLDWDCVRRFLALESAEGPLGVSVKCESTRLSGFE